jgi:branched-chain amino acid transport system permease protein
MVNFLILFICSSSIYLLIALSFLVIFNTIRFFHIAHAVVITLGAYFTYLFFIQLQLSLFIAIPLAIIFSTLIGVLCELIVYKPMRKKSLPPLAYLIASIGLYVVIQNIISLVWGDDTKTLRTGEVRVGNEFLGAYITDIQIVIIAVSLVLFILVLLFNKYSKTGKAIRAVSANPELSNIFGINSNKIILISFVVGSALGSIAGILSAFDTNMTPTMGFNLLLYGVVAMIIGGVGSYKGLIGGALLVASAQHLAAYYIDTKWMDAVAYIILILFLIWKPLGFSGQRLKKVEI